MMDLTGRTGLIAVVALVAAAACGRNGSSNAMDEGLRGDLEPAGANGLELAPKAGRQVVVSAIEGGPQTLHAPAPRQTVRPVQRAPKAATVRRVAAPERNPTPVRRQVEAEAPAARPTHAPQPQTQQRQPGVYSTEADVFRQMAWIRP